MLRLLEYFAKSLKTVPFESLGTVSYSHSTVTMTLCRIISVIKREICRKSRFFHTPAFDAPVRRSPSEYCHPVCYGNTRMVWLPDGEKSLMIRLAVSTQYRRVTDRRSDRRTSCHGIAQ